MSPAYWIYLVMAATVLLNGAVADSRFRLWRIDAIRASARVTGSRRSHIRVSRASKSKARAHSGLTREQIKALAPEAIIQTPQDRKAAEDLMQEFDALRRRCEEQMSSYVTPMGSEMYYRYQEWLIDEARVALAALLRSRPSV